MPRLRFETSTSRLQVYCVAATTTCSVVGTPAVMRIFKSYRTQVQDLTHSRCAQGRCALTCILQLTGLCF
jgi:hypothetical protein